MSNFKFGVLGAGVIGLTTALELQNQFPSAEISILADKFNRETTSDGAAGIFRPGTHFATFSEEATKYVIKESFRYYDEIRKSYDTMLTGVSEVSGYIFSKNDSSLVKNELIDKIVPLYRSATEEELKIHPGEWKYGSYFTTVLTECRRFLPWCLIRHETETKQYNCKPLTVPYGLNGKSSKNCMIVNKLPSPFNNTLAMMLGANVLKFVALRFQENKGKVIFERITSLEDVEKYNFDIVFNCMGFGTKELFKDPKLIPIRGQVIKVSAPWLKKFYYADYDTYVIPGLDSVTLGGCRNYDSYDLNISLYDSTAILDRCTQLVPSLKYSCIEREWVGLRPHRDPVRIEMEILKTNSKELKCVHNYGHGGYGVTTAPGSAKLATEIGLKYLKGVSKL